MVRAVPDVAGANHLRPDHDDSGDIALPQIFRPAAMVAVRLATLPRARAEVTRVDLEPDCDGYEERLVEYLLSVTADPLITEALAVSSASLADIVAKVQAGRTVERPKLERAAFAATRYVLRMTGRPTPFGLMAGVRRAGFAEHASARVGDRHEKFVRPDNAWLTGALDRLRREPAVRDACRVVANNLCMVRGDRLVLPYVRQAPDHTGTGDAGRELSVGYSPVVQAVMGAARNPIRYRELRTGLLAAFPDATAADADRMLAELIDREILLTDLLARRDTPDRLEQANAQLSGVDGSGPAELRRIGDLLADYRAAPLGAGLKSWQSTASAMGKLYWPGDRSPIQVDLRIDADVRLPHGIATELADVGGVLWRMAPPTDGQPELTEYHGAFLERYGPNVLVPVLEALDPHLGLGPPATYRVPRGERRVQPPASVYPRAREELLAERTIEVIRSGGRELVLDDDLVDQLSHDETVPPTLSFDLCVEVQASSVEALDQGEFQLLVTAGAGSVGAGAMAGRFARLLDADEALAAVIGQQAGDSDPILAQLYFQPRKPRNDNVALVPRLLPHILPVGTFADPEGAGVIDVRELALGANETRLYLLLPQTGREVVVVTPHMLELRRSAPNVARFLASLVMSGTRAWAPWHWDRLESLPFLPRVKYRRTVLSPARWRLPTGLGDRSLSWSQWQRALLAWRDESQVPDLIRMGSLDNHIDLDLTVPLHQQLLRSQLLKSDSVSVRESWLHGEGWLAGHANEIVLPLVSTRARTPVPAAGARLAVRVRHQPGGEWLFVKAYAVPDAHDALLRREVTELTSKLPDFVDRWFFMRYVDPDAHLRLRFHGPADRIGGELLPMLHDWAARCSAAGSIRGIVLDEYRPEIWRYGGPAAIDDAERLFQADSEAVLAQLAERGRGRLAMPMEVLAAMNYVELLGSLGEWDWPGWVLRRFPIDLQRGIRPHRLAAFALVDPERRWTELRTYPGADVLLTAWRHRAEAAVRYGDRIVLGEQDSSAVDSVLHLHANRLIGMDRDAERVSYGVLRAVVRNHVGRLRNLG